MLYIYIYIYIKFSESNYVFLERESLSMLAIAFGILFIMYTVKLSDWMTSFDGMSTHVGLFYD